MIKLITAALLGALLSGSIVSLYDIHQTRKLAIDHRCGGYQHETGDFMWEEVSTKQVPASVLQDLGKGHEPTKAEADEVKKAFVGKGKGK